MSSGGTTVASATYGPAGELRTLTNWGRTETRTYNSRMQLTSIRVPGEAGHTYSYSGTENNGRIASETDGMTGEEVVYQYDELNRLISAVTADNPNVTQWGQQFTYDGYGNLTDKDVIKGSAPVLHQLVDPATNRMPYGYDANGNWHKNNVGWLYDAENRLTMTYPNNLSFGATYYGYDPDNHRIMKKVANGAGAGDTEITFWSPMGQALGTYILAEDLSTPSVVFVAKREYRYFGSRLLAMPTDRVGSIGKYYPYGEQRGTATADEAYKFATYFRDGDSGLDYAVNRYYDSATGRFLSADPYMGSSPVADPSQWNRYAYVGGDPINYFDPRGLLGCPAGSENNCVDVVAPSPDSVSVYPYPINPFSTEDVLGAWRPSKANLERQRTTSDNGSRDRPPKTTPVDPTEAVVLLPRGAPTHSYSDYLQCAAGEWSIFISNNAVAVVIAHVTPYVSVRWGGWNPFGWTPATYTAATLFSAAALDIGTALQINAKCTREVYGPASPTEWRQSGHR